MTLSPSATAVATPTRTPRREKGRWLSGAVLLVLAAVAVLPFLFMAATSIQKTTRIALAIDWSKIDLSNYTRLFQDYGFAGALLTSAIVVTISCALNAVVCSLAAFAFEKKPFPGSEALFWVYVATMMIPPQVTLVPLYTIMRDVGLLNTHLALALPVVNAFGVFLIRQFMQSIPDDLLDAARIDGASDLQIFFRIVLPVIKPTIVALTVFTFLTVWNDFLWPLVSISKDTMQTVTLAAAKLQGRTQVEYGLVMAGAAVATIVPFILYMFLQKQFVEGVTSSSIKG